MSRSTVIRGLALTAIALGLAQPVCAQPLFEGFEDVPGLANNGWVFINNSINPDPAFPWSQGDASAQAGLWSAHSGTPNSYAVATFESSLPPLGANVNISNYLILPTRTLNNGDVINFWSRKTSESSFPDRMQVRFSPNGASTNVGGTVNPDGSGGIGDFTNLLLDINPNYLPDGSGGYPEEWTNYNIVVSGLSGPTVGRLAFRYFIINTEINSDAVGIDDLTITPVPEPGSLTLLSLGGLTVIRQVRRQRGKK